jgi:uncharacterized membrane protein YhaH (DUF805 family)
MTDWLVIAALAWPNFAVQAKRWHDVNKSAWWILINALPIVGWLIGLWENGFASGDVGDNKYGPDPLGRVPPGWRPLKP